MRKIYFLLLTVCAFLNLQSVIGQTTVTIPAANTNSGSARPPFGTYWGFERYAMIYTGAELAGMGGQVQSVAFYANGFTGAGDIVNLRIYMKTRATAFTSAATYATEISDATLVYGPTTVPASSLTAGQWNTITLATPYFYSGSDNLEIIVETNATGAGNEGSTSKQFRYTTQANNQLFQYWNNDNTAPTGTGNLDVIRPNVQLVITVPPCIPGSLSGGTAESSVASSCSGAAFNLSASGASIGLGLTYQWESSPDNTTWTPIAAATDAGLTTTQTAATWYRRKITCSGTDGYSTAVQVAASPALTTPFTENFAGYTSSFPPSCWTRSSTAFVTGQGVSAYGAGAGSVKFDFYNTPLTIELATAIFTAVPANYRLTFDHAYATFSGENDRLEILYSTNGGSSYTSLITYNGGSSGPLNTGGASLGAFTPSAAQWTAKGIALPTGTNKLVFRGISGFGNNLYLDNIKVAETPPCLPPETITFGAVTTTTAVINWTASVTPPSSGYKWEVRTSGAAGSGATGLAASGTTAAGVLTATATGLTPGTAYSVYVSSDCGASVVSDWSLATSVTTLCTPANVPYVQNFDDAVSPNFPDCLTLQDLNSAGAWKMWYDGDVVASTQPNSIRYEYDASTPADDWFFIRGLNLVAGKTYTLNFKYKGSDGPDYLENLEVKYGLAPTSASMTAGTIFSEINIATAVADPFAQASVSFTPSVSGVYYIGFHAFSDADQAYLYVDDISVESCPTPTAVTALSPTPTTATVSFTSTGNNFIVEYGPVGFVPGTTAAAGAGTIVTSTSSPVAISGLTADTEYDIYVRQSCGGGEFSLNALATVRTLCNAANVPYLQEFTGVSAPSLPVCTSLQDLNGNPTWETFAVTNATWGFSGNALLYLYDAAKPANDWFFIQGLNLTAGTTYELSYKFGTLDPLYPEKMRVAYGTSAIGSAMTNTLADYTSIVANPAAPFANLERLTFTPVATGVYYIGFQMYSDADEFALLLDSIKVKVLPVVDAGVLNLTNAPTCPAPNHVLKANLHNFNLLPIDFAVNPITVTASITGNATQTLTTTINTGTLAPGANLVVDLPAFSFTPGVYNITTTSISPDDAEATNDANTILLVVNPSPVAAVFTPTAPQVCAGGTVQVSTQFTTPAPAPATATVSSGTINLAIPDNSLVGATSILPVSTIPANATLTGISVTLNAEHTWNSDVIFNLKAPNGKILNLVNRRGSFGSGFTDLIISSTGTTTLPAAPTTPITGTYAADAALGVGSTGYSSDAANFTALYEVGNGDWTLSVRDAASGDEGTVTSWSITFTYGTPHPAVTWTPVAGLFTNSTATTAYTENSNAYSVYVKPAGTTAYTATSTSIFGCTTTSVVTVTVNPNPVINIAALPAKICISDTLVALTATPAGGSWSGIGISGNNLVPPATAIGTYALTYTYTDNLGCTSRATISAKVEDCPERIRLLRDDAVLLFPNPNNGQFNVRINSTLYNKLKMTVYTGSGLVARTQQFNGLAYGRLIPVDLTSLPAGSYMVQFYYEGGVRTSEKTFKIIVGR